MNDAIEPMPADGLRFTTKPTTSDLVWNAAAIMQRSRFAMVVGAFNTVLGSLGMIRGDVVSVFFVLLGVSFLTGAFVAPFVWWSVRQRRELVLAPVTFSADTTGLGIRSSISEGRQDWSLFRRASETDRAFLLDTGVGAAVLITKRGLATEDVAAFRALLERVGLARTTPDRLQAVRSIGWMSLGVLGAAVIVLGPQLL